jgi:hypothetical protein
MTAMVEFDETRMCNLLGNQLAQLPWNEEIIRGSNQQRRVSYTPQAFSGIISEQRVDACRRDLLRRVPGRPAIKTHLLAQRLLAEHEQRDCLQGSSARNICGKERVRAFDAKLSHDGTASFARIKDEIANACCKPYSFRVIAGVVGCAGRGHVASLRRQRSN